MWAFFLIHCVLCVQCTINHTTTGNQSPAASSKDMGNDGDVGTCDIGVNNNPPAFSHIGDAAAIATAAVQRAEQAQVCNLTMFFSCYKACCRKHSFE